MRLHMCEWTNNILVNLDHQALWMILGVVFFVFPSLHCCLHYGFKNNSLLLCTYTRARTPLPEVLHFIHSSQINSGTTLFTIPNLCQQSGRQAFPLCCLSSYLLCLMSLSPSTCALNETMVLSSNEHGVCQVLKRRRRQMEGGTERMWR